MRQDAQRERITRQRIQLLLQEPFFGIPVTRLKVREVPKGFLATNSMATDGKNLFYYKPYVEPLIDNKLKGLLAHETLHVTNMHMFRRGGRNAKTWNYACDAAIDWLLKDAGFDVPDSFTENHEWDWARGLTAEKIYERMQEELSPEYYEQIMSEGGGRAGEVLDSPIEPADIPNEEQEIRILIKQAAMAQAAKKKGSLPAWMKIMIDQVCNPKVNWKDLLAQYMAALFPVSQTWDRPNRRFVYQGAYYPGVHKEGMGEILIYNDTSGSMWAELPQMFSEMTNLFEEHKPERLHIIDCDAGVGQVRSLEPGDYIMPEVMGGGGSDFRPAFAKVEELGIKPLCAIVLSDMMISFPEEAPDYPVIGISTTTRSGPDWMRTVFID